MTAVGVADEEFSHARPADTPPWMATYDDAVHSGEAAHALWELGVYGQFVIEARHQLALPWRGTTEDAHACATLMRQRTTRMAGGATAASRYCCCLRHRRLMASTRATTPTSAAISGPQLFLNQFTNE